MFSSDSRATYRLHARIMRRGPITYATNRVDTSSPLRLARFPSLAASLAATPVQLGHLLSRSSHELHSTFSSLVTCHSSLSRQSAAYAVQRCGPAEWRKNHPN